MKQLKVGIIGAGSIGLACAAWGAERGHDITLWAPRNGAAALQDNPLVSTGVLASSHRIRLVEYAQALSAQADVLLIAVPVNGHRFVMDALLPHLRSGQQVIVSAMKSLSALYLYEAAQARGLQVSVASFGATALTARRKGPAEVNIMTQRARVGVSCLPRAMTTDVLATCEALFGGNFSAEDSPLISTLSSTSAVGHVPLALFNWTRIERAESWPQYHYMTPHVCDVIEKLDAERIAVAKAFDLEMKGVARHFVQSFGLDAEVLPEVAAELHRRRGGPPGPVETDTRYLTEDVPFGLVFQLTLARAAGVPSPVTELMVAMADLITGQALSAANDLIAPMQLSAGGVASLQARVRVEAFKPV